MIAQIEAKTQVQSYWNLNKKYSFEEYFKLEEKAPFKSEFRNGKIYPMPHGTINHALIIGSLFFYLKATTKKLDIPTLVCGSEMQVFIETIQEGLYPDGFIVVGELIPYKKNKAVKNPTIIFEVLSKSTGNYDRGAKFRKYKQIPSFQEYVLIEQDQPVIDVFHKLENGAWQMDSYIGLEEMMQLNTLDIKVALADIYEDIKGLHLPQYKMDL